MHKNRLGLCFIPLLLFFLSPAISQKIPGKKYPSLFWEITGNGLKKPSYLFGTMHVSSKMVFHLSDSFYQAIKSVDAVALELNPDVWQDQMVRLDRLQQNYREFSQPPRNDYINEKSFQVESYEQELKAALSTEPTVVNSLLYRSYKSREDFEEDTFLDLYIFQTGKKLGKRATGVENYYETERIILEAYNDMGKEKKKRNIETDGESLYDIEKKSQDAYRRGDLDLLDSLDRMIERSDAFREKFLYLRNEIQANSIDTILRKSSLFVGVGAAHLAGERGVIDLLRKKGYTLRPIFMTDRDALQKESVDKLKVPVRFIPASTADGLIKMEVPGPLYKMSSDVASLNRLQYSDMSNGSYYLVTRVQTHGAFLGQSVDKVLKKVDSLLYEFIPGRIIKKEKIVKNGYKGFDISNRTRRGDLQRYQVLVTPFEVIVFKMSGKENYVDGQEANKFFSSIELKPVRAGWAVFEPRQGGFSVKFPGIPHEQLSVSADGMDRWEYEAIDPNNSDAYLLFKKPVHNINFLEEDSFDLSLIEESFRLSGMIDKQLSRKLSSFQGYPALDVTASTKDGNFVRARFMIAGPHYYLLAARSKNQKAEFKEFFSSFNFAPFRYGKGKEITDTFLHYKVISPVMPELEQNLRAIVERFNDDGPGSVGEAYSYWPKTRNALFRSDSTSEMIGVSVQQYPKYYHVRDSASFWTEEISDYNKDNDMITWQRDSFSLPGGILGYKLVLRDTNSSRLIKRQFLLKGDRMYRIITIGDTIQAESNFVRDFYETFRPFNRDEAVSIFKNKLDIFITDLFSKDSTTRVRAEDAISNLYYGEKGLPKLLGLIDRMQFGDKQYFENKSKFIAELGYIRDASTSRMIVQALKQIYEKTADTSTFQNEVFRALARQRSKESYAVLKDLLLQDPPIFENSYEYGGFFRDLEDSLLLTKQLFPELLELSTIDDYKDRINSLLVKLVDSGLIKAKEYESFYNKIYFDARIELKKQLGKDEKILERETSDDPDRSSYDYTSSYSNGRTDLDDYAVLLLPFYDRKPGVTKFFEKLLRSRDPLVQLNTAGALLRFNKPVPDSLMNKLASSDKYRARLYAVMERAGQAQKFPLKYNNQLDIARSNLYLDKNYDKVDSIVLIDRRLLSFKGGEGYVYFFKYRVKKEDDWKMGISGLQPADLSKASSDDRLAKMTEKRLKDDEPVETQFNDQLRRLIFSFRKSSKNFYDTENYNRYRMDN